MNDLITVSLETVFDAIPVGLGVVDPDHRIVLMNQTFREQLGLPPDAIPSGTPVADAVHASAVRGVYGPGDPDEQVTEILSADRTRPGLLRRRSFAGRHFDLFNTPIHNGAYIVTAVETTDQVATRAEAETALAQTASALTTLRIGLAVFDRQRHLLLANPSFAALLALPRERLTVGVSFDAMLDMMQARTDFAGPEADGFIESLRYAASGVPSTTRRQRADGRALAMGHARAGARLQPPAGELQPPAEVGVLAGAEPLEEAAELLAVDGVAATVWDVRVVRPLDPKLVTDAGGHRLVVTIEDGLRVGGAGSFIADAIADLQETRVSPPVLVLGVPTSFIPHGSPELILSQLGLDGPGIAASTAKALPVSDDIIAIDD